MGYLDDPEKTSEAVDEEGWLHSGDLGIIDEDDFLYITGRIKVLETWGIWIHGSECKKHCLLGCEAV